MKKLLILRVKGAKLFHRPRNEKHNMNIAIGCSNHKRTSKDNKSQIIKRTDEHYTTCPPNTFLASNVAGALYVLAGQRPVPTIRKNELLGAPSRDVVLDKLAKNAMVEITSGINIDPKTGEHEYLPRTVNPKTGDIWKRGEALMTRKSYTESNDPMGFPIDLSDLSGKAIRFVTWDRLNAQESVKNVSNLLVMLSDVLNRSIKDITDDSLAYVLRDAWLLNPFRMRDYSPVSELKAHWKSLLVNGKLPDGKGFKVGYTNRSNIESILRLGIPRGMEWVSIRDAIIYVPVDETELSLFSNGSGWATLLDGGLVTIEGVEDYYMDIVESAVSTFNPEGSRSCI